MVGSAQAHPPPQPKITPGTRRAEAPRPHHQPVGVQGAGRWHSACLHDHRPELVRYVPEWAGWRWVVKEFFSKNNVLAEKMCFPVRGFQKFPHTAAPEGTVEEGNWMKFSTSNFLACPLAVIHCEYFPSARMSHPAVCATY